MSVGTDDSRTERKDLTRVTLSSPDVIGAQYVSYTLTNHSAKESDYVVKFQVLDAAGNRVDNSLFVESNVEPGQTVKGKSLVTGSTGERVRVTDVERTQSLG